MEGKQSNVTINSKPKYQDVWATILFAVFLAGYAVCAGVWIPTAIDVFNNSTKTSTVGGINNVNVGVTGADVAGIIFSCLGTGIVLSLVWFFLMLKFAGTMITISYITSAVVMMGLGAYFFYVKAIIPGIIWVIFGVLFLVSYWFIRHRIPFAKVVLKTVTRIVMKFPGTIFVAFVGLIISLAYNVIWILTLIGAGQWVQQKYTGSTAQTYAGLLGVFLLFELYWFSEVVRNTVHVSISGTFATYYFMGIQQPGSNQVSVPVKNVSLKSAGRAITTSFGSVCYGSLLIAIIATLRALANSARNQSADDGNILCCLIFACISCILAIFQDILQYLNKYAYSQVAIYGKDYCSAAKATWTLFKTRGFEALANDNLIGSVLFIGALTVGMVCASVGLLYVKLSNSIPQDTGHYVTVAIVALLLGSWMYLILTEVITSGVATTFVCLAEDPATLQRQQPELYAKVLDTWPDVQFGIQTTATPQYNPNQQQAPVTYAPVGQPGPRY
jgi:hypothetical protein